MPHTPSDTPPLLTLAVMTYNRPDHLRNCLDSIARHAPLARLMVVDDSSDDPRQVAELARARDHYGAQIVTGTGETAWHGGLYNNMQRALEQCETPLLFYIQDDTQLVRTVTRDDIQAVATHLTQTGAGFAYPFFLKIRKRRTWPARFVADPAARLLRPLNNPKTGAPYFSYSDNCIANVPALRAAGWTFAATERGNEIAAESLFAQGMAVLAEPWGFYCPEVPIFRNRTEPNSVFLRLARPAGDPVKALVDLSPDEVARLRARVPLALPFAEDWLKTVDPRVSRPFVYQDVKRNKFLWVLYEIEQWLRGQR